MVRRNRQK